MEKSGMQIHNETIYMAKHTRWYGHSQSMQKQLIKYGPQQEKEKEDTKERMGITNPPGQW